MLWIWLVLSPLRGSTACSLTPWPSPSPEWGRGVLSSHSYFWLYWHFLFQICWIWGTDSAADLPACYLLCLEDFLIPSVGTTSCPSPPEWRMRWAIKSLCLAVLTYLVYVCWITGNQIWQPATIFTACGRGRAALPSNMSATYVRAELQITMV